MTLLEHGLLPCMQRKGGDHERWRRWAGGDAGGEDGGPGGIPLGGIGD